jgi:hypothetical protein
LDRVDRGGPGDSIRISRGDVSERRSCQTIGFNHKFLSLLKTYGPSFDLARAVRLSCCGSYWPARI